MVDFRQSYHAPEAREPERVAQLGTPAQRRLALIRENAPETTVRVKPGVYKDHRGRTYPAELVGDILKHSSGLRLRPTGSTEWPNDEFTKKRIADGTLIKVE
jgi:hypothetical protein